MCHETWRKGDPGILRRSFLKIGFANIDHQALGLPAFQDGYGRGYKLQAGNELNENDTMCLNVSGLVSKL